MNLNFNLMQLTEQKLPKANLNIQIVILNLQMNTHVGLYLLYMVMKRYWHLTLKLKLQTVCSDEYHMHWQPKM